ncbi:MAG: ATP-binding protein [Bryobacteraceae bacterium]
MGENQSGAIKNPKTVLESTLESVDSAENLVLEAASRAGFEEEDLHKLGMAVREAMVNAVVHGNRYNARKKVHLAVEAESDRVVVRITDEGEGFEPEALPDPLAEENLLRQSGRGLLLIQAFVDEFEMQKAPPLGTEVRLVKYRGEDGTKE